MTALRPLILIVEDDADDVLLLRKALGEVGFAGSLEVVTDGSRVLEAMERCRPDLVLLDLNLPRKSGLEVLRELKGPGGPWKGTPVVVLTTSKAPSDVRAAYLAGANSYIVKPMSYEDITAAARVLDEYWMRHVTLPQRVE